MGRRGPRSPFSLARRIPTARMRQGVHSPTRRTQLLGTCDPESQRGPLPAEGRGCRKRQLGLPGCQAQSLPPLHTRPIGSRAQAQPLPVGAPGRPRPPGKSRQRVSRPTCSRDAAQVLLGSASPSECGPWLLQSPSPSCNISACRPGGTLIRAPRHSGRDTAERGV